MGLALASELRGFVHHVKAGDCTVEDGSQISSVVLALRPQGFKRHVVLIDEADCMSKLPSLLI